MKLWYCILVFKNPRKLVIKWPFLIIFSSVFLVWKLDQERQHILHIFNKYSNQGLFSADENLILKLFMFRPQNLLEKLRKCLTMLLSFLLSIRCLKTCLGNIAKTSNFQQIFYSMHVFFNKMFDILFHLHSKEVTRKYKDV